MELIFRFLGLTFTMRLGVEEQPVESYALDSHTAFGFAPDPVFPDLIWEDE